jgi:hypothetical protein
MLKYLRIAVTVLSLTACVLLIALWVRSDTWIDIAHCPLLPPTTLVVESTEGTIAACGLKPTPGTTGFAFSGWGTRSLSSEYNISIHGTKSWRFAVHQYDAAVGFPHWFAILISGTFAALPWIGWSSRFNLRTLLITTTLVAVALGIIAAAR